MNYDGELRVLDGELLAGENDDGGNGRVEDGGIEDFAADETGSACEDSLHGRIWVQIDMDFAIKLRSTVVQNRIEYGVLRSTSYQKRRSSTL